MKDEWLTTEQAAELSGYHIVHIRRLLRAGEIEGRKWGQAWQVSHTSLLKYIEKIEKSGEKRGPKPK